MRDTAELIANMKSGRSSAHAYILEGSPKEARDEFISGLLAGLGVHGLDIARMEMSGDTDELIEKAVARKGFSAP